jgi:hypothetical protein
MAYKNLLKILYEDIRHKPRTKGHGICLFVCLFVCFGETDCNSQVRTSILGNGVRIIWRVLLCHISIIYR